MEAPLSSESFQAFAFSFVCGRCGYCCVDKIIQVNPYEIFRLARACGMSTTEFIATYTSGGGMFLRFNEEGRCFFLDEEGCSVHADRPLVCRLYPLGRDIHGEHETFFLSAEQNQCQGLYGTVGTVLEYLEQQVAGPFMAASNRYRQAVRGMLATCTRGILSQPEVHALNRRDIMDNIAERIEIHSQWMDIDKTLVEFAGLAPAGLPTDPEQAMEMHIVALGRWWDQQIMEV